LWIQRIASLAVTAGYVIFAAVYGNAATVWTCVFFPVFGLACIWFGDEMGAYKWRWRIVPIDTATPGAIVRLGGWVLLLLPLAIFVLSLLHRAE